VEMMNAHEARLLFIKSKNHEIKLSSLLEKIVNTAKNGKSEIRLSEYDITDEQIEALKKLDYQIEFWSGTECFDAEYTIKW
jgi:hypothetical protein